MRLVIGTVAMLVGVGIALFMSTQTGRRLMTGGLFAWVVVVATTTPQLRSLDPQSARWWWQWALLVIPPSILLVRFALQSRPQQR